MKRIHVLAVALLLGAAAALGVLATTRTAGLRSAQAQPRHATAAAITARARRLDRVEASLRRALHDKPPALPTLPVAGRPASVAPRIVYQRPAPIVLVQSTAHHDDANDHESDERGDDD